MHLQGFCPFSPSAAYRCTPKDQHWVNSEIERFDMSEAAEQLETMAVEAKMLNGTITDLIKKMETLTSGYESVRVEDEQSTWPHGGGPVPLHPSRIKQELGCISQR